MSIKKPGVPKVLIWVVALQRYCAAAAGLLPAAAGPSSATGLPPEGRLSADNDARPIV